MAPAAGKPIALDHNFPVPLVQAVADFVPEFDFRWIKDLPTVPGEPRLNELDDHDLVYELHRRAFPIMVTNNHKMLDDDRVLVAIEGTRLTIVGIERAGDDPVFATGVLLRDLLDVLKRDTPKGLYYGVRPARASPRRARDHLIEDLGHDWNEASAAHARRTTESDRYPEGDPRRVR